MLDPRILRNEIETVAAALKSRGYDLDMASYTALEAKRKSLQMEVEALQSQRNASAKSIGQAKAAGEDIQPLLEAVEELGTALGKVETHFKSVRDQLLARALDMPNLEIGRAHV